MDVENLLIITFIIYLMNSKYSYSIDYLFWFFIPKFIMINLIYFFIIYDFNF